jgi:hypothetical protein
VALSGQFVAFFGAPSFACAVICMRLHLHAPSFACAVICMRQHLHAPTFFAYCQHDVHDLPRGCGVTRERITRYAGTATALAFGKGLILKMGGSIAKVRRA